jgi:DHA2 family multidrug resistance protein
MGNATSIFNLMRNIGGSIGIAGVTTIVFRNTQRNINVLGARVTPYGGATQSLMRSAQSLFFAGGSPPGVSGSQAYGAVFGIVARHAAMSANIHAFRLLAIIFLSAVPLVFVMRKPRRTRGGDGPAIH